MHRLFEIASSITTPIGLAALALLVLYAVLRQVLRSGTFSPLSGTDSAKLLGRIISVMGLLAVLCVLVYLVLTLVPYFLSRHVEAGQNAATIAPAPAPVVPPPSHRRVDLQVLRNLTYVLDGEPVTLTDGALEFTPTQTGDAHSDLAPQYVYLTQWAFGDLQGTGTEDAVAVLQKSDGGSGIYYYLVPVLGEAGRVVADTEGYVLGDRLQFRRIQIQAGEIGITALMHRETDPLSQPSLLRELTFRYQMGKLVCLTLPCSEVQDR